MAVYHILIVDDQKESRKRLKGFLDTLELDLRVVAVPSGEEALLELRNSGFDLLLTDFALPGINGIELLKKAKKRFPGLKVILITGEDPPRFRRDRDPVAADYFLSEPLDMATFLDAIERCLGVAGPLIFPVGASGDQDPGKPVESIAERLTRLRQALGAKTCLVLDNTGAILACAGGLPDETFDSQLLEPVIDSFYAGIKISRSLQSSSPVTFQFFSGLSSDLILAQVGSKNALLVILDPVNLPHELSDIVLAISEGADDLRRILMVLGIDVVEESEAVEDEESQEVLVDEAELQAETPRIEALFKQGESAVSKTEDLDAFWRSIAEDDETANEVGKADMLTYEQALQLGLAPEDQEDE